MISPTPSLLTSPAAATDQPLASLVLTPSSSNPLVPFKVDKESGLLQPLLFPKTTYVLPVHQPPGAQKAPIIISPTPSLLTSPAAETETPFPSEVLTPSS